MYSSQKKDFPGDWEVSADNAEDRDKVGTFEASSGQLAIGAVLHSREGCTLAAALEETNDLLSACLQCPESIRAASRTYVDAPEWAPA